MRSRMNCGTHTEVPITSITCLKLKQLRTSTPSLSLVSQSTSHQTTPLSNPPAFPFNRTSGYQEEERLQRRECARKLRKAELRAHRCQQDNDRVI